VERSGIAQKKVVTLLATATPAEQAELLLKAIESGFKEVNRIEATADYRSSMDPTAKYLPVVHVLMQR
jgi:hypothetical protein